MKSIEDSKKTEKVEDDGIFQSKDDMNRSLSRLCYGDLYLFGRIWIKALQAVLVGATLRFFPIVEARSAQDDKAPQKPPKMKYQDLPIYTSPHNDYKKYIECNKRCPEANQKLLHNALLPHVKTYRKSAENALCQACVSWRNTCKSVCGSIEGSKKDFKRYMRDPNNLMVRQGVVASGTFAGFLIGGGGGIPRRVFFTGLGAFATGALCFPKEADETFRDVCYQTAKVALVIFNIACKKDYALRERVPCKDELPPPPPPRKTKNQCPIKK